MDTQDDIYTRIVGVPLFPQPYSMKYLKNKQKELSWFDGGKVLAYQLNLDKL